MVGVLPGHRRKGIFRRLMERVLEDARTREEPLSVLWSTEGDLYGRFGYGLGCCRGPDRPRTGSRGNAPRAGGRLQRPPRRRRRGRGSLPVVYDAVRAGTPGMASRSEDWWRSWRLAGPPGAPASPPIFRALLEVDGRVEGYALYRVHGSWTLGSSTATLEILEAMGSTPPARRRSGGSCSRSTSSSACVRSTFPSTTRSPARP